MSNLSSEKRIFSQTQVASQAVKEMISPSQRFPTLFLRT